LIQARVYFLI